MSTAPELTPYGPSQTIYQHVVRPPSNGMAVTAMVLGIVAIAVGVWSIIPILGLAAAFFAFVPGLLAIIFGAIGRTRARALGGIGNGSAMAGLVLGTVTIAIIVLTTIGWILLTVPVSSTSHSV